jgi:hypothetical protein
MDIFLGKYKINLYLVGILNKRGALSSNAIRNESQKVSLLDVKLAEVFTTWRLTSSRILGQKLFKVVCEQTSPPAADPPGLSSASSLK